VGVSQPLSVRPSRGPSTVPRRRRQRRIAFSGQEVAIGVSMHDVEVRRGTGHTLPKQAVRLLLPHLASLRLAHAALQAHDTQPKFLYPAETVVAEERLVSSRLIALRRWRAFASYACPSARASRCPLK